MTTRWNADGPPDQPVDETCLSFVVRGDWAHFRRIEGNIVKQTYRIMPRTTTAGLIAAILGLDRDSYYDRFGPDNSAVAIEPLSQLRAINMPINALSTAGGDIQMQPSRGHARIGLVDPNRLRQQHNYEFLVDPAYRIDIWLDDDETHTELQETLDEGESHYVPSLGLSECLASIEYLGDFSVEAGPSDPTVPVDSAVVEAIDDITPSEGQQVRIERSPGFMEYDDGGRTTTGFVSYAYHPDAGAVQLQTDRCCSVDGRTVMFA